VVHTCPYDRVVIDYKYFCHGIFERWIDTSAPLALLGPVLCLYSIPARTLHTIPYSNLYTIHARPAAGIAASLSW